MVTLYCYDNATHTEIAASGDSFAACADLLRKKVKKWRPGFLTLDFNGVLDAIGSEHFATDSVGTASKTGMFSVVRSNKYNRPLTWFEKLKNRWLN